MSIAQLHVYYFLLATSPDTRFTFAGCADWNLDGKMSLQQFEHGQLVRQWHWSDRVTPSSAAWSADSTQFAVFRQPQLLILDMRNGRETELTVGHAIRGLWFGPSGELLVQVPDAMLIYDPWRQPVIPHRVSLAEASSIGGQLAYFDGAGALHFLTGTTPHGPELLDRFRMNPSGSRTRRSLHVSASGDYAYVVHWLNNSRARIMSVPADLRAAPTCSEIDLPYRDPRAKWIGAAASSLLLLETGPLGIDVVRLNLPEGTRQSLGRIHAAHASFVHGIDRSLHIMAEGVRRRMISRVDSNSLVPIMQTCADLSAPQVVRERVCALVIAERGRPHWRLHIDGRCVLDEPCAPSARAQRASRIKRCGSGHLVPGDPSTAVGIIYVPSLFGPDRVWGQAPFFQHVLFSITRQLHGEGFAYFVMKSLRGARRERELLIESVALRLEDALEQLRSAGCKRIGIIGGSIAGYALTRCSELVNRAAALMLLSPVHQLSPPIARRFGYDTADSLQDVAAAIASRASLLSTPTVIMHGIRDELSPSIHSSVFISSMPVHVAKCYLPIMDEGHIFQHFHNWRRLTTLFTDFARLQLRPDGNLQSRR